MARAVRPGSRLKGAGKPGLQVGRHHQEHVGNPGWALEMFISEVSGLDRERLSGQRTPEQTEPGSDPPSPAFLADPFPPSALPPGPSEEIIPLSFLKQHTFAPVKN